jgi:hypothetical protein
MIFYRRKKDLVFNTHVGVKLNAEIHLFFTRLPSFFQSKEGNSLQVFTCNKVKFIVVILVFVVRE